MCVRVHVCTCTSDCALLCVRACAWVCACVYVCIWVSILANACMCSFEYVRWCARVSRCTGINYILFPTLIKGTHPAFTDVHFRQHVDMRKLKLDHSRQCLVSHAQACKQVRWGAASGSIIAQCIRWFNYQRTYNVKPPRNQGSFACNIFASTSQTHRPFSSLRLILDYVSQNYNTVETQWALVFNCKLKHTCMAPAMNFVTSVMKCASKQ